MTGGAASVLGRGSNRRRWWAEAPRRLQPRDGSCRRRWDRIEIDERLRTEAIWEKIRDEHIADATVLLVLAGLHTRRRKFVDWEIGSALKRRTNDSRRGELGIVLPDHPDYGTDAFGIAAGFSSYLECRLRSFLRPRRLPDGQWGEVAQRS